MNEIVYGFHAVQALLKHTPERLQIVFIMKDRKDRRFLSLINDLKKHGVIIQMKNRWFFNEKSKKGAIHQGIIAYIKSRNQYQEKDLLNFVAQFHHSFLLILDGITDPRNLGACLRSADAAGVHIVIAPKDRSAKLNETVRKVACGAAESVPFIRVTNLARTMSTLKKENIWIIGTTEDSDNILYQTKMSDRLALVMGAEDKGIRRLTREYCDELISIPMTGSVSSLNIAVATGICLFEVVRQRSWYSIYNNQYIKV